MFIIFKTDKTNLMIKGDDGKLRHIPTVVQYAYTQDDCAPDFDYGNELENRKEMKRFESGELSNLCIKVTASALGETGTDYLGQCFVTSAKAESELLAVAIEHDMKNNACLELKGNILLQYKTLKEALCS